MYSINPARSFGASAVAGTWTDHWVFWIGPLTGAVIAAVIYDFYFRTPESKVCISSCYNLCLPWSTSPRNALQCICPCFLLPVSEFSTSMAACLVLALACSLPDCAFTFATIAACEAKILCIRALISTALIICTVPSV